MEVAVNCRFTKMVSLTVENVEAVVYNWWERNPSRINFYSAAAATSTATTITSQDGVTTTVDVSPLLHDGCVLLNSRSSELIVVNGDPSGGLTFEHLCESGTGLDSFA